MPARTIPRGALRAALARARTIARRVGGAVTVGYGYKHARSRDNHGYGAKPTLAIAFFVRYKRALSDLDPAQRLPSRIDVVYRGIAYRIPTDVETLGDATLHSIPPIRAFVPGGATNDFGTPGFLLRSDEDRSYLITAGHVLFNRSPVDPWPEDEAVFAAVGATTVGVVDRRHTYMRGDAGRLDAGVVRLRDARVDGLPVDPWDRLTRFASLPSLREHLAEGRAPARARVFGAMTRPPVLVDKLIEDSMTVPLGNGHVEIYAPVLIHYRSVDPDVPLVGGDSGAPLVTPNGMLLGIHLLSPDAEPWRGFAQAAVTIVDELARALGTRLRLVPNAAGDGEGDP